MTRVTAGRGKRVRKAEIPKAPDLTREQRIALGKAARAEVPRSSHAEFTPAPQRPDPVALLENQGTARVPELLPIRYGRMAVSAFTVREFASTYADQNERDHRALVDAIASGRIAANANL